MSIGRGVVYDRVRTAQAAKRRTDGRVVWQVIVVVCVLRLALLLILHHWSVSIGKEGLSPFANEGDDGGSYYRWARDIADGSETPLLNIYPLMLGFAMKATGVTDIFPYKLANCLVGCACVVPALLVFRFLAAHADRRGTSVSGAKPAALVIALIGLYPSGMAFTLLSLYRDAWIYLLHLTAVYLVLRLMYSKSMLGKTAIIAALVPLLVLLQSFRWYACASVLLGVLIWAAFGIASQLRRRRVRLQSLAGLAAMAILTVWLASAQGISPGSERLERLGSYRAGFSETGAGSNLGVALPSVTDPRFLPLYAYSLISNVFGPFPYQASRSQALVAMITEVPVLLFVAIQVWKKRHYLDRGSALLLCQAAAWFLLIAYANDNLGTAARLRVVGWHCVFILYGYLVYAARSASRAAGRARARVEAAQ